jgi:hypothetical protein
VPVASWFSWPNRLIIVITFCPQKCSSWIIIWLYYVCLNLPLFCTLFVEKSQNPHMIQESYISWYYHQFDFIFYWHLLLSLAYLLFLEWSYLGYSTDFLCWEKIFLSYQNISSCLSRDLTIVFKLITPITHYIFFFLRFLKIICNFLYVLKVPLISPIEYKIHKEKGCSYNPCCIFAK